MKGSLWLESRACRDFTAAGGGRQVASASGRSAVGQREDVRESAGVALVDQTPKPIHLVEYLKHHRAVVANLVHGGGDGLDVKCAAGGHLVLVAEAGIVGKVQVDHL